MTHALYLFDDELADEALDRREPSVWTGLNTTNEP